MTKYVWLNIQTGNFSNSWDEETHKMFKESITKDIPNHFKLIKYECISDPKFEFYEMMKLR